MGIWPGKKYGKDKVLTLVQCTLLDVAILSPFLHGSREAGIGFVN